MHENFELILTLTGGMTAAVLFGYVAHRFGLSPIVGYLIAGVAVGPNTPGFVANRALAEQLAEIGVILLMFGVGLHFHPKDLLAVRRVAVPGAIGQSAVATILGMILAGALGWGWGSGLVYGLSMAVASTVVLTRVLADHNNLHTPTGHIAVGWLVVEDLFTVIVLVVLPAFFGPQQAGGTLAVSLALAALKVVALVAAVFVLGGRLIPWLLGRVAVTRSRELFTLTVLVVALGIAVASAKFFGVSMALGAFLAGMIVGRSEFSLRAASEALPMRDAFAVLFFVSVGMLFDPHSLTKTPVLVIATLAIVMLAKPLVAFAIVLLLGHPLHAALGVAVALGQIGEFSFILASMGRELKILPDAALNGLVIASIVSIALNPLLYRALGPVESWVRRRPRFAQWLTARVRFDSSSAPADTPDPTRPPEYRAVVVGYGPIGQTLARLLSDNGVEPTIVEMNWQTVERLRAEARPAVYGDAGLTETLEAAGVPHAGTLILSASSTQAAGEIIRRARELNPRIRVLARSDYLRDSAALRRGGADQAFSGEGEVALAMTEAVLRTLGATPEQIDRERDRVRGDLFGTATDEHAS